MVYEMGKAGKRNNMPGMNSLFKNKLCQYILIRESLWVYRQMLGLFGGRVEIAGVFRCHLCLFCGFLIVPNGYVLLFATWKSQGIVN